MQCSQFGPTNMGFRCCQKLENLLIPFDDECEYDEHEATFFTANDQSFRDVREQLQDRRNARDGCSVLPPYRRGGRKSEWASWWAFYGTERRPCKRRDPKPVAIAKPGTKKNTRGATIRRKNGVC